MFKKALTYMAGLLNPCRDTNDKLPCKNPMDWSWTESSTPWYAEQYCEHCLFTTVNMETLTGVCNDCGLSGDMGKIRNLRTIWLDGRWVVQVVYDSDTTNYSIHASKRALDYSIEHRPKDPIYGKTRDNTKDDFPINPM